jgi:hypothetical protein
MLCPENMSPLRRFAALNKQVLKMRGGVPLKLDIEGEDHLRTVHQDLMLESAATSVQVHLKVPQHRSVRLYNASLIASALTVATAANAPLLFGKRLWDDTRIPLFEQAVDTAGPLPRVSFGDRYLQDSLLEIFEGNLSRRVMLPVEIDEAPARMPYTRLHNGTIWNWNRPLIGFEADGQPHLRIEHRPMSASPSIDDLFADTALYLGLVLHLADRKPAPESELSFEVVKSNFYRAARFGLAAEIDWLDQRRHLLTELLLGQLVDAAFDALSEAGVEDAQLQLGRGIIRERLEGLQNGAAWQRRKFEQFRRDPVALLLAYQQYQAGGLPVHRWD